MKPELKKYVDRYGGKHGILLYLWEHVPWMRDYLVPMRIIDPAQPLRREFDTWIQGQLDAYGVVDAIIRTSHPADWWGLVDAMPTRGCETHLIKSFAEILLNHAKREELCQYAVYDGIPDYLAGPITVSVSAKLDTLYYTVTEHPNRDGIYYFDLHDSNPLNCSYVFDANEVRLEQQRIEVNPLVRLGGRQPLREAVEMIQLIMDIRALNLFDPSDALQFELGWHDGPKLFQVRYFAQKQLVAESEQWAGGSEQTWARVMGVTPREGAVLHTIGFGELNPSRELYDRYAYLRQYDFCQAQTVLRHQTTDKMKAYLPVGDLNPAMSHNHTRFAQVALRNQTGIAVLGSKHIPEYASKIRVWCDGWTVRFQFL